MEEKTEERDVAEELCKSVFLGGEGSVTREEYTKKWVEVICAEQRSGNR